MTLLVLLVVATVGFTADAFFLLGVAGSVGYLLDDQSFTGHIAVWALVELIVAAACLVGSYFRMKQVMQQRIAQALASQSQAVAEVAGR